MADSDPTQTGGQQEEQLSPEEQIAAKVNAEQAEDLVALDVDENGDLQFARDEKGRFAAKEAKEEPEPVSAEADIAPVVVVADTPRKRSVKVYGQEEEVPDDVLIEHGIKAYQKDRAADIKLQEAARRLRQIEAYEQQVQGRPPQGADHQPQALPTGAPTETDDQRVERVVYNREATRAGNAFKKDFPEIAADPHLMNMAWQLEQERLATVAALGEPYGDPFDAYRGHGETIQKWLKQFKPTAPVVSEDKVERKRTIVAVPAVNAKAPAPQEDKPPTIQQIIAEERKARLGRPNPNRSH